MSGEIFIHNLWWHEMIPYLVYSCGEDHGSILKRSVIGQSIAWKCFSEKKCPGYINLRTSAFIACHHGSPLLREHDERCVQCEYDFGFKSGFLFGTYRNSDARYYFSQDHYLYIAIHHEEEIKIGTANALRKYDRLYEQGATMFMLIASGDIERIKSLESFVSSTLGISQRSPKKAWINLAMSKIVLSKAEHILKETAGSVIELLLRAGYHENVLQAPEMKVIQRLATNEPQQAVIEKPDAIYGEVVGVVGKYLVVRQGLRNVAYDKNLLIGHRLCKLDKTEAENVIVSSGQLVFPL